MSSTQDSGNGYAKVFDLRDRLAAQAAGIPKTVDDTQEDIDMTAPESPMKQTTEIARPVTVEESNLIRAQVVETTEELQRTVKRVDQAVEQVERTAGQVQQTAGQVQQTTMKVAQHTELLEDNDSMINSCGNDLFQLQEQVRCNEEEFERFKEKTEMCFRENRLLTMEAYAIAVEMAKGSGNEERIRSFWARIARIQEQVEANEQAEANGDVDGMVADATNGVQRMGM
ncbi:hypothetical protein BKA56DRAFT_618856 [Ilyonectria sp. MPI-CAGE-AT-0026]|nr:hypothetical protein BKA56DRAFT_618856 [Ilyonectria sp. MPI-CAGE-AT-0026]